MQMQNINVFLRNQSIEFHDEEKLIRWVKSMKPKTIVRIGKSYFINEIEMTNLLKKDLKKKEKLREKRKEIGRLLGIQTALDKKKKVSFLP
jgi:hypothetical protein